MMYHPKLRCDVDLRTMIEPHNDNMKPFSRVRPVAWFASVSMLMMASITSPAQAQIFARSTVITNARIITMNGEVIEKGSILIQGNTIKAVGKNVKAPFLASTIDASGKTITPGLIDAWSALGFLGGANSADPKSKARDAFDMYDRNHFREALQNGVTTIYLGAYGGEGVTGIGSVIQLAPGKMNKAGKLLKEESALCVQFGSHQPAISRLKTFNNIRKQFKTAVEYRESLEDYEEELEEYLEKLKERKKENEKSKDKDKDEKENGKDKKDKPEKKPEPDKEKPDKKDPPSSLTLKNNNTLPFAKKTEKSKNKKNGKNGDEDEDEEEDELEKPKKPKPDRNSEILLKAIDHEIPIRVEAHRSEDILNAVELSKEFNLDLMLEGATDAYLLADELSEANIPVILGSILRNGVFVDDEYRRHSEQAASTLGQAGVLWTVGSGANYNASSRFVAMNAQQASAHGAKQSWLETVTVQAAKILEISNRVGRIRPGMSADLVIWSTDPNDAAAKVNQVYIGGQLVYKSKQGGS